MDKNDSKNNKAKKEENLEEQEKSKSEVAHLKQEVVDLENQAKRIFADYQNLEKRVAQEKRDLILSANQQLLLRLLPVLDTLMLALRHTQDKGLELAIRQFTDALTAEGVKKIDTKDKKFDPHLMECISVDKGEEGKVLSEIVSGYTLNDEVIRPAMVKVGKKDIEKKEESDKILN